MFAIVFGGFCVDSLQEAISGIGKSPLADIFLSILFVAGIVYFTKTIEQMTYWRLYRVYISYVYF